MNLATTASTAPKRFFQKYVTTPASLWVSGVAGIGRNQMTAFGNIMRKQADGGKILGRADIRHNQRTGKDTVLVIPWLAIVPAPFLLPAVPLICKYFPRMVPSTFHTAPVLDLKLAKHGAIREQTADKIKAQVIQARFGLTDGDVEVGKDMSFQQKLVYQLLRSTKPITYQNLHQLVSLFVRSSKQQNNSPSSSSFFPMDLLSLSSSQCSLLLKHACVPVPSSPLFTSARVYRWADWILKDDSLIRRDGGVSTLSHYELLEALDERGYSGLSVEGTSMEELRKMLLGHTRFTKFVVDEIRKARITASRGATAGAGSTGNSGKNTAIKREEEVIGHDLDPDEVCIVAGVLMFARGLNVAY